MPTGNVQKRTVISGSIVPTLKAKKVVMFILQRALKYELGSSMKFGELVGRYLCVPDRTDGWPNTQA
jgi:hypothetical protein